MGKDQNKPIGYATDFTEYRIVLLQCDKWHLAFQAQRKEIRIPSSGINCSNDIEKYNF